MSASNFWAKWDEFSLLSVDEGVDFSVVWADSGGVALIYSVGGCVLVISAGVLLLALFVVLELTRGLKRGALRAV